MLSLAAFLAGLAICLGLIVSIGAQNSYVLRQGIRREHVGAIVLACIASEVVLQTAGVAGVAVLVEHVPWLDGVARWAGAIFLVGYAFVCARRAWRGGGSLVAAPDETGAGEGGVAVRQRTSRRTAVLTILALTWLNPHALIETTLVMGSIAATHGEARWSFLVGGLVAAAVWFVGFGYGARLLAPVMRTERAWRILDAGIAVVMLGIAVGLVTL
ncbi:LysE/ArgO family amino acid transporter [Agrococcus sp. SGAir0287]|uniref:LysE/ArgO family amino acid transporter n=1 Tax=Agrococcus sp. SGAir0287 TaxID=2070347 RepID=UPI0020C77F20|nr:LysE/ArgO family amino acid transporter [Agrococcus sp. SGAir0287]